MKVLEVKQNPKKPEQGFAKVVDDSGVTRDAWTPGYEAALKLVESGHAPDGWKLDEGEYGWRFLPPKEKKGFGPGGGGAAAFRNTKEGQAYEQERMDRRTALMQANAQGDPRGFSNIRVAAEEMYTWLRATSGTPAAPQQPTASTAKVDVGAAAGRAQESVVVGEAAADSCSHYHPAFTYPNGRQVPDGKFYCEDCRKLVKG